MPCLESKICYCFLPALPLCSAQVLWLSLHIFIAASLSASSLYFIAILQFKSFFSDSACKGVSLVCNVELFLASLSAVSLSSSPPWEGTP